MDGLGGKNTRPDLSTIRRQSLLIPLLKGPKGSFHVNICEDRNKNDMKIKNPVRTIQYLLLFLLLMIRFVVFSQNSFTCSSQLHQVVNGADLKYPDPGTREYLTIGSSAISYIGAGFNYEDNYIYGIGGGDALVRIAKTGQNGKSTFTKKTALWGTIRVTSGMTSFLWSLLYGEINRIPLTSS